MQNRFSRLAVPILLGAAYVVALAAVRTDYDHRADFSKYHTYSWIGVKAGNSIWQDRIMRAVDGELINKGWKRVESGGDAALSAFGKVTERDNLETFYTGFPGWGWRYWGGMGTTVTQVVPERVGNLNVDIFDGGTKYLLWRGSASNTLSSKPEKNSRKLEEAVADMFKHFPPPPKT
jgi:hypothetical protein